MRFHTHNSTPKPSMKKSVKIMLAVEWGFMLAILVAIAIASSIYGNSAAPAVLILATVLILTVLLLIILKDLEKAYIEINGDTIRVVDYYLGIKKEKSFLIQEIANAEIVNGYSMHIRGYRYSTCGCTYIVFRDNTGKYLFKVLCVPETKQFFDKYLNHY